MAYNAAFLESYSTSPRRIWTYRMEDGLAAILATDYFATFVTLGGQLGDIIQLWDPHYLVVTKKYGAPTLVVTAVGAEAATASMAADDSSINITGSADANTTINFGEDSIVASAGGVEMVRLVEDTQDAVTFNNGAVDVDFNVKKLTSGNAISYDAGANTLGLNATTITLTGNQTLTGDLTVSGGDIDAGASGAAGTLDIFPVTASKGKLQLSVTDQTGDTTVGVVIGAMAAARTITLADPGATANLLTSTGVGASQMVRQSADVVKDDGAAASALTGLVHTLQIGTYAYKATLQCLSTANAGVKITMALTTAVLSSIQNVALAFTASGVAGARSTTATSGATLYGATAAITQIVLNGTFVVTTGGTLQLQGEQNASHADESTFYTGSTFEIFRIA